ncbi:MAG TPA: redoxin domain-containing protein [Bryobacteraceae bacterium]|jgi:cytochrome c biogenesis protein CcmG/thiol:disulfide interchange protein DsbE
MFFTRSKVAVAVALGSIALFSACSNSQSVRASAKAQKDRKPAPNFTLSDANGKSVSLAEYKGKVVLLNFWATWCGPCSLEIPWFKEFEQQYKSQGFAVLGVSMDDDGWQAVKPYIAEHKINYRVLLGNDSVSQLYGGLDALPTTFIIDRDGNIAYPPHIGLVGKNEYLSEIQGLLGDKPASAALDSLRPPSAALVVPTTK